MNKIVLALLGIIFLVSAVYVATEIFCNKTYSWRYKMTVEIETPEGIKTGSSVWEINAKPEKAGNIFGYKGTCRGDAVVVNLGERGYLFAMKRGFNGRSYVKQIVFWTFPTVSTTNFEAIEYYSTLRSDPVILPPKYYPLFVHLKDINNPKTIESVYERHNRSSGTTKTVKVDKIEEVYGQGVKIKSVTIGMTDDPVEFKIHKILKWLSKSEGTIFYEKPPISKSQPLQYLDFQEGRIEDE